MENSESFPAKLILPISLLVISVAAVFIGMGNPEYAIAGLTFLAVVFFISTDSSFWLWSFMGCFAACSVEQAYFGGMVLNIPAEPLTAALLGRLGYEWLTGKISKKVFLHPISSLFLLYIFWMLVACFQSQMLLVSIKQTILRISFIAVFYFLFLHELLTCKDFFMKTGKWFLMGFLPVIAYVMTYHSYFHFSKDASGFSSRPFFHDHTQYAAVLCLCLPWLMRFKKYQFYLFIFLLVALYLSYCRAAYVSFVLALLVFAHYSLGFSHRLMAILICLTSAILFLSFDTLYNQFKANKSDSNAKYAGVVEQARSITNITTDQSNAERINRWKSALRMIEHAPLVGFGPGTYQFTYLPFQRTADMTRISVTNANNHTDGRGGTAHNEYLLHAAEMGVPSLIFYLLICLISLYKAFSNAATYLAGMAICTYFLHGFFNNFLDTVSVSFLFYATIAHVAASDIRLSAKKDRL